MTHRFGSSGKPVAKLSTIHLTVAMDMPRKPFEANTNTRRVMVKTSFEIVEQNARSLREICFHINRACNSYLLLQSSGNLQGHERNDFAKFHASPMQSCRNLIDASNFDRQ